MKNKVLFASCVLAATFAGCQNEEFESVSVGGQATSGLVEVGDNFMIASVGATTPGTRTNWVEETVNGKKVLKNIFSPVIPNTSAGETANTVINGTEVLAPTIGACNLIGGSIHSNYEFYHYGWLGKDQTKADQKDCPETDGSYLFENGWLYSELNYSGSAPSTPGDDAAWDATVNSNAGGWRFTDDTKTLADGTMLKVSEMNPNSGIYKTENKAMFEGDYILYYPYNPDFSSGALYAESKVLFDNVDDKLANRNVSDNTFRYAYAPGMVGGTTAASFEFKNLSGILQINLKKAANSSDISDVSKIMLYSPSAAFLKKVSLNPSAIAAGQKGTSIYGNEKEYSKTILLDLKANATISSTATTVYVAALPTTVPDLVVYAYADGKWASYEVGNMVISAGRGEGINVTYDAEDFENKYLAVDATTLNEAITNVGTPTEDNPAVIEILGNITLDATVEDKVIIPSYVTVKGDKITVPEGVRLDISENATIEATVDIEGETCCSNSKAGGAMWILRGGIVAGDVNVLAGYNADKADGTLWFAAGTATSTSLVAETAKIVADGNVIFKGITDIRGTLTINQDGTATVGDANGGKSPDVNVKGGTVNNNGTFTVAYGRFAMLNAQGVSNAAAGENFHNNGTFVDKVGTNVTGGTPYMLMGTDAQYICEVDDQKRLDEAYLQKPSCNIIKFVAANGTNAYAFSNIKPHANKDVDLVVDATAVSFAPGKAITVGNLSVTEKGALAIKTDNSKKDYIKVNGNIDVYGSFTTEVDVQGMEAKNLTVYGDKGTATFKNRKDQNGVTLTVSGTIDVQKGAVFTINPVTTSEGKNVAIVYCKDAMGEGTYNGSPTFSK